MGPRFPKRGLKPSKNQNSKFFRKLPSLVKEPLELRSLDRLTLRRWAFCSKLDSISWLGLLKPAIIFWLVDCGTPKRVDRRFSNYDLVSLLLSNFLLKQYHDRLIVKTAFEIVLTSLADLLLASSWKNVKTSVLAMNTCLEITRFRDLASVNLNGHWRHVSRIFAENLTSFLYL